MKYLLHIIFVGFSILPVFGQSIIQTLNNSASQFENQKNFAAAIAEISKALAIEPKNADLYLKRAADFVKLKKNEEVFKDVQTAFSKSK